MSSAANTFKNKKEPTPTSKSRNFSIPWNTQWRKDPKVRTFVGLMCVLFSLFLSFAFLSYFFTAKSDQSILENWSQNQLQEVAIEVDNLMGISGAWLAHWFIYKGFGIASFLFPPYFFYLGYRLLRGQSPTHFFKNTLVSLLISLFWISTFLGFFVTFSKIDSTSIWTYLCGIIGFEVASFFYAFIGASTPLFLLLGLLLYIIYKRKDIRSLFFKNLDISDSVYEKESKSETSSAVNPVHSEEETQTHFTDSFPEVFFDSASQKENTDEANIHTHQSMPDASLKSTSENEDSSKFLHYKTSASPFKEDIGAAKTIHIELDDPVSEDELETYIPLNRPENSSKLFNESSPESINQETPDALEVMSKLSEDFDEMEYIDPTTALPDYTFPPLDILKQRSAAGVKVDERELQENKAKIVRTLTNFKIGISKISAEVGPTVTLYEIVPSSGVKVAQIRNLEEDIMLNLAAYGIRIIAPMPGRGTVGIEVPNKRRETVSLSTLLRSDVYRNTTKELPIVLGKTISNEIFITDLAKMPHLLIGGATGQGKSVGINVIIASLLYKKHPGELKFVLIDPKKVEFSLFNKLQKHYLAMLPGLAEPVVTDPNDAVWVLESLCVEMDRRYDLLKAADCRQVTEYNEKFKDELLDVTEGHRFMPYIVTIIDELADLMLTSSKSVEKPIARLAQMARAVGIHLVVATQRPSVNVLTGVIKANFPARMAFRVSSKIDSRVILDNSGADQLVGQGDMLLSNGSVIIRLQCAYIDTAEVEDLCNYIEEQPSFSTIYPLPAIKDPSSESKK